MSKAKSEWVGVGDVAEKLEISKRSVLSMIRAEKLPSPIVLGREYRWRRSLIEAWIAAGCPSQIEQSASQSR